jgi:hypothetical protein
MKMPAKQQNERDMRFEMRETLNELIREQVVHRVGFVADLLWVHVRPLWENHYRVNVFVGKNATSARVASSYFLAVDGDGNILSSSPLIAGQRIPPVSLGSACPEVSL